MVVLSIAKNELKKYVRDNVVTTLGIFLLLLLSVSVYTGVTYYKSMAEQHAIAEEVARIQWENQGEKNPHSAAHYGTFAFKPVSILSVFDPGVDKYTGVSIFLEAHRQNFAANSIAEDKDSARRFAELTPSFIFAYLFPLFLILAGFRSVISEKESGMYRFLKSQGVTNFQLVSGKTLGLWGILILLFLPFLLIGIFFLMLTDSSQNDVFRFLLTAGIWLIYFGIIINITIAVSAWVKSSGSAMILLLTLWILSTLLVPRLITNLATNIYPVPNTSDFYQAIRTDLLEGIDGHNPYSEHSAAFRDSILVAYGVEDVSELPFNFRGLMLQEGEEFEKRIYDHHFAKIDAIHQQQIGLFTVSSVLSPTLAARLSSMAIAGTDMHAFNHFTADAEEYRISLMRELNMDLKLNAVGDRVVGYTTGSDFFAQNISFTYERPDRVLLDRSQLSPILMLIFWFFLSAVMLIVVTKRSEVVT